MKGKILVIFLLLSSIVACNDRSEVPAPKPLPHLNEVLTNSVSDTSLLRGLDYEVERYMNKWELKGTSLAVVKNDSLVYAKGYGAFDYGVPMEAGNIFRLASISKLVTATGIMVLAERDSLHLEDNVFGPGGILENEPYTEVIKNPLYNKITVEHVLRHEAGFTTYSGDPMFSTLILKRSNRLDSDLDADMISRLYLRRRLGFEPGTSNSYSNYGYLLLSMIIEKVTGQDYETWIRENVLEPAGCFDFHIAYNYYEEKYPNETRYFLHDTTLVEDFHDNGKMVERCYGGSDIRTLSGAGAWVASTPELARFVSSIDGREEVPDIISSESVARMTKFVGKDNYGIGWNDISEDGIWTRTGTLAETTAIIRYYPDGECWIFVSNTGTWRGARLSRYTSKFLDECRALYSASLPSRNLFE